MFLVSLLANSKRSIAYYFTRVYTDCSIETFVLTVVCIAIEAHGPCPYRNARPVFCTAGVRPGCQGKSLLVLNSDADTCHDLVLGTRAQFFFEVTCFRFGS